MRFREALREIRVARKWQWLKNNRAQFSDATQKAIVEMEDVMKRIKELVERIDE